MSADNVVVVDVDGNLLASGMGEGDSGALAAQSDNRRAAEAAFATEVEYKVGQLLNSVLGPNRSVVEANVTLDWTEREVTTQAYDPEQSVVRSSQILTESYNAEGDLEGGIPGAESNLPDPDLEADLTGVEGALYSRSEEITNYEVTQIQSFEIHAPGSVERMTLSVLVDGVEDPAQLQTLQAAITAAAGIDAERGDVLAVETLTFDRSFYENQAAEMAEQGQMDLYIKIGTAVASALMIGALLWYVQRLLANLRLASADAWQPLMMTAGQAGALRAGSTKGELMAGAGGGASAQVAPLDLDHLVDEQLISAPPPPPKAPVIREDDLRTEQAVTDIARDNPAGIADIIHLWLSEDEHA
jgi:flagellar M-ring protein FliF